MDQGPIAKEPRLYRLDAERIRELASLARRAELRDLWNELADAYERFAKVAANIAHDDDDGPRQRGRHIAKR
jgi:hypothetical protein